MSKKSPQLRFEGFTDDWEQRKLSGIIEKLSGGASIKPTDYLEDGIRTIPKGAVNATGIAGLSGSKYISEDFFEKNITSHAHTSNLVTSLRDLVPSAPNMGRIVRIEGDDEQFLMPQGVYKLELFEGMEEDFLISFSNSDKYRKIISAEKNGSTQVHIRNGEFLNIDINLPSEHEQNKIGSFFKQLDNTIALHQRKLDLLKEQKKGYLQKMFPKNGEKVPELRFAGFADDWEERKLSSMTNYKNGKSHEDKQSTSGKLELINLNSISISGGLKHSGKFIDEADDTLQKDDLVMILSDVGHGDLLGRVALIPEDDRFVLNQRVALLRPNTTADPQFLFSYINAHQYYFKAQGAGMSQLNISKGSVENFISFVPIIEEQKKIGAFYKRLDDTIALHQRKLDLLKEQKKGFLQKMFPKNGAKVPELRFAGFADDWELRKSKELCTISTGKGNTQDKVDDGAYPFYVRSATIEKSDEYLYDQEAILTVGDGVGTGKVYHYVNGKYNLHQRVYRMYDFKDVSAKYFYYYFSKNFYKRVMSMTAKTSVDSVRMEMIADMNIVFPSVKEQENIVELFSNLDNTIALHQRKLDLLKEQKKGFLQKIFV